MTQIYDLQQRADVLRKKTATDSISPEEVGGLHADTLAYIANMERYASSLGIKKVYTSVSEMNGDESPVSSTGMPLKAGQLVTIFNAEAPDAENSGEIYAFQNPGWVLVGRLDAGTADTLKKLIEGDKTTVTNNNRNAFVWLGNFETWAEAQAEIDKLHATGEDNTKVGEFRLLLNGRNLIVRNFVQNWATGVFTQTVQGSIQWNVETQTMDQSLNIKTYERRYNEGTGWTTWEEGTAKIELAQELSTEEGSENKAISQKAVSEVIDYIASIKLKFNFIKGEYYNQNGAVLTQENWERAEIDVELYVNKSYNLTLYGAGEGYVLFMTSDKKVISFKKLSEEINEIDGIIPSNCKYILVSNRWATNENPVIDIEGTSQLLYKCASLEEFNSLKNSVNEIKDSLPLRPTVVMPTITWEQGAILANGTEPTEGEQFYDNRIKTKEYFQTKGTSLYLNCNQGYGYRIFTYSSDKSYETYQNYDNGGENIVSTSANKLYRFVLLRTDNQVITPAEFSNVGFYAEGLVGETELGESTRFAPVAAKTDIEEVSEKVDNLSSRVNNLEDESIDSVRFNSLDGKRVVFIGDSITAGSGATSIDNAYNSVFCKLYNAILVNKGVSSTCIANNTSNGTSSQRFITRATAEDLQGAALIVVFGGTNDFSYDVKPIGSLFNEEDIDTHNNIGDKKRVAPTDTDTFAGALHELIKTIRANAPIVPIVFMTPMNRGRYNANNPTYDEKNKNGDYLSDFSDAIKSICAFYSIPVLDLQSVSELDFLDENIAEEYSTDKLHPNDKGHKLIGNLLYRFVENNVVI